MLRRREMLAIWDRERQLDEIAFRRPFGGAKMRGSINRRIAEQIGLCHVERNDHESYDLIVPHGIDCVDFVTASAPWSATPRYTTRLSDAMSLVKWLLSTGGLAYFALSAHHGRSSDGMWLCTVRRGYSGDYTDVSEFGRQPSRAIAKALASAWSL